MCVLLLLSLLFGGTSLKDSLKIKGGIKARFTSGIPATEWFMLRLCVRGSTWSTDGRLDAGLLQNRNSVDCTLDVLHEYVPVQVKQAEGKLIRHLGNKIRK